MVHYHFDDKRDLLLALLVHGRRDWIEPLEELVDGPGTARARMAAVIVWVAEPATREAMRVHTAVLVHALGDELLRERLAAEYARWRAPFVTCSSSSARSSGWTGLDAKSVGGAFASAADGLVQQMALDPDLPTARMLTRLYERALRLAALACPVAVARGEQLAVGRERPVRRPSGSAGTGGTRRCVPRSRTSAAALEVEHLGEELLAGAGREQHPPLGIHRRAAPPADRARCVDVHHVALVHDGVRAREDELLLAVGRARERGMQDHLGALQREAARHLREPAVVADHQAGAADARDVEHGRRRVARRALLERPPGEQLAVAAYEVARPARRRARCCRCRRRRARRSIRRRSSGPRFAAIFPSRSVSGPGSPRPPRRSECRRLAA